MKTLPCIFVASFFLASSFAAPAELSARGWLETYYLDPHPAELAPVIHKLSREGYFEQPGHTALAIGFLATVFEKNPDLVDRWLLQLNGLPLEHHRLIASALWQAGNPLGADMFLHLGEFSRVRPQLELLVDRGRVPILETPVLSPSSMNLQWGAFLASGDERHILCILEGIGTNRPELDAAALASLAENAAAHPRVLEICQAQLARQPEDVRGVIRAALKDVKVAKPRT